MTSANVMLWGMLPSYSAAEWYQTFNVSGYNSSSFMSSKSITEMVMKHEVGGMSAEDLVNEHFGGIST